MEHSYVDPLGHISNDYYTKKPYLDEVDKLKKTIRTRVAQYKDFELKNNSQKMQITLLSIFIAILLLILLIILRNFKQ